METASNSSMKQRTEEMKKLYPKAKITITAFVHNETLYNNKRNNALGMMVENRLMTHAHFEKGKSQPYPYLNTYYSGNTAWNATSNNHLQELAEKIANEMEEELDKQRKARKSGCQGDKS